MSERVPTTVRPFVNVRSNDRVRVPSMVTVPATVSMPVNARSVCASSTFTVPVERFVEVEAISR